MAAAAPISKLRLAVREHRLLDVLRRRARTAFYTRIVLMSTDLDREQAEATVPYGFAVGPLTAADLDAYLTLRPELPAESIAARLAAGHVCIAVWLDGAVVAAVWIRFDAIWLPIIARTIELPERSAYAYDSFTERRFRRRGVTKLRSRDTFRWLRANGYATLTAIVMGDNAAGRAAATAAGLEPFGEVRWLHLGSCGIEREVGPDGTATIRVRGPRSRRPELAGA